MLGGRDLIPPHKLNMMIFNPYRIVNIEPLHPSETNLKEDPLLIKYERVSNLIERLIDLALKFLSSAFLLIGAVGLFNPYLTNIFVIILSTVPSLLLFIVAGIFWIYKVYLDIKIGE